MIYTGRTGITTKNGVWLLEIGAHKQTHKSMVLHRERKFTMRQNLKIVLTNNCRADLDSVCLLSSLL